MTVCSYYLRGACKYGDRCRNEHPATGTFGNQTWTSNNNRIAVPYTTETMSADVTALKEKPLWPLSSYGPAKFEPILISGLDESPEELRLKAVNALKAGTTHEYTKYEGEKTAAADQVYTNARNNIKQLYEQALKVSAQAQTAGSASAPSAPASTTPVPSAFGSGSTPSVFGRAATSAFGKPAFGQATFGQTGFGGSASSTSAFGTGTQGTPTFGGTSTQPTSAFGQPSQPTSAFGQGAAPTTSVFGQASQSSPAFGQPSAFGATSQPTSVFAQPSTQPTPSQPSPAFGQPQPTSAFGQPPQPTSVFAQPAPPTSAFSPTSQPTSGFAQPAPPTSAFSQTSQPTSAFGQPSFGQSSLIKPASGAFGGTGGSGFSAFASQPSAFTSATAPSNSTTSTMTAQSAFGSTPPVQSAFGAPSSGPKSAFAVSQPSPLGVPSFSNTLSVPMVSPASAVSGGSPFATSPMTVTPSSEKSASGAPDFAGAKSTARMKPGADRYLELFPRDYSEMIPPDVKAAFTNARFEWGKIPDWIPPEEVR